MLTVLNVPRAIIHIRRRDIVAGDIRPVVRLLGELTATPNDWRRLRGQVLFAIDGWNTDPREIFEIPEVRAYWAKLDRAFPAWSYFVVPGALLRAFLFCLLQDVCIRSTGRAGHVAHVDADAAELAALLERTVRAGAAAAAAAGAPAVCVQAYEDAVADACTHAAGLA